MRTTIVSRSAALERAQFVQEDGLRTGSVGGLTNFDSETLALAVEIESLGIVGVKPSIRSDNDMNSASA